MRLAEYVTRIGRKKCIQNLGGKPEGTIQYGYLDVDGRIILK
jgi:hypothetical protein